ncbi:hypothetical protein Pla175_17580 [Pirellulimonas nuda]|uniref:Uncharacterized protein n=1 Tax=Pirellulimonas nuda TaxID=2528009 RepID=A0A518DA75_9BACT|nr:hypothetical protein [Pirellulimonas nuda]QDU88382.1 hypothetical protein Pla175_17580 [Pirellulimonas nuda]
MTCPRCQKPVVSAGELTTDGKTLAVYQCDDCTTSWELGGKSFKAALTFAVDAQGRFIDPDTLAPIASLN